MRSHDLNRLLDEPGPDLPLSENIFSRFTAREGLWDDPSPAVAMICGHHCNGALRRLRRLRIFRAPISRVVLFLAEPTHSTRGALMRWF